jgi:hypothetical protein
MVLPINGKCHSLGLNIVQKMTFWEKIKAVIPVQISYRV